jgi:hypothetical protein
MKEELEELERLDLDTDKATIISLWFGAGGFIVGVIQLTMRL